MITERAAKYLSTLAREPALRDRIALENAFHAAGVPPLNAIIDFQMTFGGYVQHHGLNTFVLGIIHERPDPDSFFERNRLTIESDDEEPGNYFITCANCHASDHWFLDAKGQLYWCFSPPLASSFAIKIERDAVQWELRQHQLQRLVPSVSDSEFIAMLVPLIEQGRIEEASDQYESLFLHRGVYAAVSGNHVKAFLVEDAGRSLLTGLPVTIDS